MKFIAALFQRFGFLVRNPWSRLWMGLPAIAFMVAAIWIGAGYGVVAGPPNAESVIKRAKSEISRNELDEARIVLERYLNNYNEDPDVLYHYAAVLLGLNQIDRGLAIFRKLAPDNAVGHIPSQIAVCQLIIRQPGSTMSELKHVESRLNRILAEKRDHSEAIMMLVELNVRYAALTQNQNEQRAHIRTAAGQLVKLASDRRPWLGQRLGALYLLLGEQDNANRWFQAASQFYENQTNKNVDDHASRVSWAQAEFSQKRYEEAYQILRQGLATAQSSVPSIPDETPEKKQARQELVIADYRKIIADVRAGQIENMQLTEPNNLKGRIEKLSEGLQYNPRNQVLLTNLVKLSQIDSPEARAMASKLKELQVQGTDNSALQFVLGVDAYFKKQNDQAKFHFERALQMDPAAPFVANNLAFLMAQSEEPDLKRARTLINAALEKQPTNIDFIDTRGMIRIKQGEYKDGIVDLEQVNQVRGTNLSRHELLANAYEKLGDRETATLHQKAANNLRAQLESQATPANPDSIKLESKLPEPSNQQTQEEEEQASAPSSTKATEKQAPAKKKDAPASKPSPKKKAAPAAPKASPDS